jgi:hypothetical protein
MNTEIGNVTISYTPEGNVEYAIFDPSIKLVADKDLLKKLKPLAQAEDSDTIRKNAETVMAAWFMKVDEVELSDRFQYKIHTEVVRCERYTNNKVRLCELKYSLEKVSEQQEEAAQ